MKKTFILLLTVMTLLVSCGKSKEISNKLRGEIIVDGSSTVAPITQAVAEEFSKENSEVNISVGISGTGGGFKKFVKGEIDIADASRKIKSAEIEEAKKNGIEYIEIVVGLDALTVVTNKENTWMKDITVEELKKIWIEGSTVKTWKDVNPSWPEEAIKLYGPDQDSGTYDYFIEEIIGKDGKIRKDYSPSSDDNQLVKGVEGDKNSLGFFGYAYYLEQKDKMNALSINGVSPSDETVKNGKYKPLSRPLFIYVNKKLLTEKQQLKSFVKFYIEKIDELLGSVGYVPLDDYSTQKKLIK